MAEYRDPLSDPLRDPGLRDPDRGMREPDPMLPPSASRGGGSWGWIVGVALVVAVLAFVMGWGRNTQTASDTGTPPPARMSQSAPPPAAPATQPSTTGQGSQ